MKKQNKHFIVPHSRFNLMQGSEALTTYTFNTHQAKHVFCKICGVQSFYQPRSNPDGYGMARIQFTIFLTVTINYFDNIIIIRNTSHITLSVFRCNAALFGAWYSDQDYRADV
jgi:hypothetical protein